jgi:hypothetical protein
VELTLGVAGRMALVVASEPSAGGDDLPDALRWLVALMVEDPPTVWPPALIGTAVGDPQRIEVHIGERHLGELGCSQEWWELANLSDRIVLVARCGDGPRARRWFGGLELAR